jgi:hypothetical protein
MKNRIMTIGMIFATLLVVIVVTVVLSIRNVGTKKTDQPYGDLESIISAKYGQECVIVVFPPLHTQHEYLLAKNDLVFQPGENVKGTLQVKDGGYGFGFHFSYEVDPDNVTIVCAVKSKPPGAGWCKVVLKEPVSATGFVEE